MNTNAITTAIAGGHVTAKTIVAATGLSKKQTSRAIHALWVEGKITRQVFPSSPDEYAIARTPKEERQVPIRTRKPTTVPTDADLLQIVWNHGPLTAAEIAKSINTPTRNVNPVLYALQTAGRVVITGRERKKPIWAAPSNE